MAVEYSEVAGDLMARVRTVKDLNEFATEGGWENATDFLDDFDIEFREIKNKWFCVVGGRLYMG